MPDNFFDLPKDVQRAILNSAESQLNVRAIILEKDIWICWLLNELFTLPLTMSFKGGTSLSKVYGLIHRFSEDLDITLDYRNFGATDLSQPISKSALKKLGENLKIQVKECVNQTILPHIQQRLKADFPNESFKTTLSEDGEQLRIFYPTLFDNHGLYLQGNVLIEFGGRNSSEPSESHTIFTLIGKSVSELHLPTAQIKVLSPMRTFWEKATLIHVECHRGRLIEGPDRLFRHWYDLAKLMQSWVGETALVDRKLLEDVIQHKTAFFNASYANYEDCLNKKFKLIPHDEALGSLEKDYLQMQGSGMFSEKPITFFEIVDALKGLELRINS